MGVVTTTVNFFKKKVPPSFNGWKTVFHEVRVELIKGRVRILVSKGVPRDRGK